MTIFRRPCRLKGESLSNYPQHCSDNISTTVSYPQQIATRAIHTIPAIYNSESDPYVYPFMQIQVFRYLSRISESFGFVWNFNKIL